MCWTRSLCEIRVGRIAARPAEQVPAAFNAVWFEVSTIGCPGAIDHEAGKKSRFKGFSRQHFGDAKETGNGVVAVQTVVMVFEVER